MKTTVIVLLALGIMSNANAAKVDQTLKVDKDGEIRIEVIEGKVVVEGWNKPEVRVKGSVPNADEFVFKTSGAETRIEIESEHGFWGRKSNGHAKLTIYAPRQSTIVADGASSSFAIVGVDGGVDVNTMSGDINLEGGNGTVELESVSGDVTVTGAKGRLELASVSGDVMANVEARRFEAQSVSGDIEASIGQSEHVELESVSGDVELNVDLVNGGELDADTVSGNIDIKFLNQDLSATFEIETGPGGEVKNRISDDKGSTFLAFSGSLEFKVGKGKSSVELETMSGTIKIDR